MALGATAGDVGRQVIGDTLRLATIGIAVGLIASLAVARLIASLLFGTSPGDITTFVTTALALAIVAIFAGAVPAFRAATIDPMRALRTD
jgi:ABC-type antimicrobial peptide transport system permease subunit